VIARAVAKALAQVGSQGKVKRSVFNMAFREQRTLARKDGRSARGRIYL
jgi:hypothetical protein